jgi:hypothetical protein
MLLAENRPFGRLLTLGDADLLKIVDEGRANVLDGFDDRAGRRLVGRRIGGGWFPTASDTAHDRLPGCMTSSRQRSAARIKFSRRP